MSNLFYIGEVVIVDGPIVNPNCVGRIANGDEVTLLEYSPGEDLWRTDRMGTNGKPIWGFSKYFRKRPQQDDNLFTEWAKSRLITDLITDSRPTEKQVRVGAEK